MDKALYDKGLAMRRKVLATNTSTALSPIPMISTAIPGPAQRIRLGACGPTSAQAARSQPAEPRHDRLPGRMHEFEAHFKARCATG